MAPNEREWATAVELLRLYVLERQGGGEHGVTGAPPDGSDHAYAAPAGRKDVMVSIYEDPRNYKVPALGERIPPYVKDLFKKKSALYSEAQAMPPSGTSSNKAGSSATKPATSANSSAAPKRPREADSNITPEAVNAALDELAKRPRSEGDSEPLGSNVSVYASATFPGLGADAQTEYRRVVFETGAGGDCLYHSIAYLLRKSMKTVRSDIAQFLAENKDELLQGLVVHGNRHTPQTLQQRLLGTTTYDASISQIRQVGSAGDSFSIYIASIVYGRRFLVELPGADGSIIAGTCTHPSDGPYCVLLHTGSDSASGHFQAVKYSPNSGVTLDDHDKRVLAAYNAHTRKAEEARKAALARSLFG